MEEKIQQADMKLKRFVENIEKLELDKKDIQQQISDIYKEVKSFGFDTKAVKEIIKIRKVDTDKRIELEQLIETYKDALGMLC